MKENRFSIGDKTIETPSLVIRKNIMTWDSTMIQLSNISLISAANIDNTPFPLLAALAIIVGLMLLGKSTFLALILIAIGAIWIYFWYKENEKRKMGAILTILMNSGHNLYFKFSDRNFLLRVVRVLEQIITNGNSNQISINLSDCTITGNAQVLNGISE